MIAYEHAPSYPDAIVEPDRSVEFGGVRGSHGTADRRFVTVSLE
ncbi:hypothetical protein [Natrinema salaciae]|nr:hypothetical protein [Natrinema salaciae]